MRSRSVVRPLLLSALAAGSAVALGACTVSNDGDDNDLVAGKQLFVQKCGSCHVLERAGTKGTTGPNLDEAFQRAQKDGFGESAIRGVIRDQIDIPGTGGNMPADLVEGNDADNVAAYVAKVVAKPGKDEGLLATAVKPTGSGKAAVAVKGRLSIAADPNGQLAFVTDKATASPGRLTIEMPNTSGVPHNIAIAGKGTSKVIEQGSSAFTAEFAPGTYTFVCEVAGHEEAGMKGTLTVK